MIRIPPSIVTRKALHPARCCAAFALLATLALATGCGHERVLDLPNDATEFDRIVLSSDKPVLVHFYKTGCASCATIDPVMESLAAEYAGRVTVARFRMLSALMEPFNPRLYSRYNFTFFPTVILFVRGKEAGRWVWVMDGNVYRRALDLALWSSPPAHLKPPVVRSAGPSTQPSRATTRPAVTPSMSPR